MKNSGRYIEGVLPLLIMLAIFGLSQAAWAVTPQISTGANHTVTLRSDGTIWASGSNSAGQIGDGSGSNRKISVQVGLPGNATDWVAVAAGMEHTLALKSDGSLWAWGSNQFGQLGNISGGNKSAPVRIGTGNNWTSVAAGGGSSFALKADGTLWAWGANNAGQLGDATTAAKSVPTQVSNLDPDGIPGSPGSPYMAIAAGAEHTLALKADGSLWAWGANQFGQLGDGTVVNKSAPVRIGTSNDWKAIAAGGNSSFALNADGTFWAWGRNSVGQLGIGSTDATSHTNPVQVGTGRDWLALSAGDLHTLAVKRNGTLWAWGDNSNGQLGDGTNTDHNTPVRLNILSDSTDIKNIVAVAAGALHSFAVKANGEHYAWGSNGSGQFGDGTTVGSFLPFLTGTDVVSWVASEPGMEFTAARKSNGTLWTWGNNISGQLGDNTFIQSITPVMVGSETNWVAQATGMSHTVALKADGTLWTWGENASGQLGDGTIGTTNNSAAPKQITVTQPVSAANDWTAVAAGDFHTLAVKADGTLWVWGDNSSGQLGNGDTTDKKVPVQIDAAIGNHWVAVAAGDSHSLALQSDGTLWSWGDNGSGQLGDPAFGTTKDNKKPNQIANFTPPTPGYNSSWVAIAAGLSRSLALQADGTLWAWGANNVGQLGNGDAIGKNVPVQVLNPGSAPYVAMTAGDSHTVARQADGSLWSWGNDTNGQLGSGVTDPDQLNPVPHSTPVRESTNAADWVSLGSGGSHTVALKAAGSIWAWGSNSFGQLGDGTTVDKNTPATFTEARISVSPGTLAFNTVAIGAESTQTITMSNTGTAPMSVTALSFGGPDGALFSAKTTGGNNPCGTAPFTLALAGSCTVRIDFKPTAPGGAKVATLTIASNDPKFSSVAVALSGTASVQYALTAAVSTESPAGSGTITPSGTVLVLEGASQTFTITPNAGYHVADVTMDGVSQGAVTSMPLSSVKKSSSITAIFAINTYTVTMTAAANGGVAGPVTVNHGAAPIYTFTPNNGYHIADVAVDGVSQGAVTTLTLPAVTANKVITASFAINTYAIIATADAKGSMTPATESVSVNHGANQTFTFIPNAGYSVVDVIVDGVSQGSVPSFTFTIVTNGNHSIRLISIPDGDVNIDGKVDIADALHALRITVGLATPGAADTLHGDVAPVDSIGIPVPDKQITVADALMILRKVVGLTTGW